MAALALVAVSSHPRIPDYRYVMSTAVLSTLTLACIVLLCVVAFAAHRFEEHKRQKSRRAALHRDRARDLAFITEVLPREALEDDLLKALFHNILLHLNHSVDLDPSNYELKQKREEMVQMNRLIQKGADTPQTPLNGTLGDQLKDAQRALKMLKDFVLQQHKAGVLSKSGATRFVRSLQDINLRVMIRGLIGQAKHNVREGHKSLAIHYFQLAYNELLKSNKGNKHVDEMNDLARIIKELKMKQVQSLEEDVMEADPSDPQPAGLADEDVTDVPMPDDLPASPESGEVLTGDPGVTMPDLGVPPAEEQSIGKV